MSIYRALKKLGLKKTRLRILEIILEEEAGIRAGEVRQCLKENYDIEITIQATIDHLKKLAEDGFVKRREKLSDTFHHPHYVPSQTGRWLLATAMDNVYKEYKFKPFGFDSKFRRTSVDFPFRVGEERSLADFETKLIEFEKEIKKDVASFGPHWWFLKAYKSLVFEMMHKITHRNRDVIGLSFVDTPVARNQARKAKGDLGINLSICSGSPFDNIYFYVFGPVVTMAFYPAEVNAKVTRIFRSHNSLEEIPKGEFEEILESKNTVKYAYAMNDELASLWLKQARQMLNSAIFP